MVTNSGSYQNAKFDGYLVVPIVDKVGYGRIADLCI